MLSLYNTEITDAEEKPTKTYGLNIDEGRIIGNVDGIDALRIYIRKTLITPRFRCLIYSNNYGSEINSMLVANSWDREIAKKMLPKLIENALTDSRIESVDDFSFIDTENALQVSFMAHTVYGDIPIKEMMQIV